VLQVFDNGLVSCPGKTRRAAFFLVNFFTQRQIYPVLRKIGHSTLQIAGMKKGEVNFVMCQKAGESVTAPLTTAASGIASSSTGLVTTNALCDRVDCSSYGKWVVSLHRMVLNLVCSFFQTFFFITVPWSRINLRISNEVWIKLLQVKKTYSSL